MTATITRRLGAAATIVIAFGLLVPAIVIPIQRGHLTGLFGPDLGAAAYFSLVGAFLLVRGPVLNLAVILCIQGASTALTTLTGVVREDAALRGPLHGAAIWFAWVNDIVWLVGICLLVPLMLLFPDGRLWRPGWRWPIVVTIALGAVGSLGFMLLVPGLVDGHPPAFAPNPTAINRSLDTTVGDVVGNGVFFGLLLSVAVSLGALIARRRRANGVSRAQLTCLFYGGALTLVLVIGVNQLGDHWWAFGLGVLALAPIAAAIAVAVLRYRLYEIDRVISRTVTYAAALIVLAGIYVGVLAAVAAIVPRDYGQVGVAAATLAVTVLAVPLTRRVRRLVDRRFNRRRYDAQRLVTRYADAVRRDVQPELAGTALLDVVHHAVEPRHAVVWLVRS